jgi:hypothetical protein
MDLDIKALQVNWCLTFASTVLLNFFFPPLPYLFHRSTLYSYQILELYNLLSATNSDANVPRLHLGDCWRWSRQSTEPRLLPSGTVPVPDRASARGIL